MKVRGSIPAADLAKPSPPVSLTKGEATLLVHSNPLTHAT
jgi:hypothetical protein